MAELNRAAKLFLILTGILGVVYPIVVTTLARIAFPHVTNGSFRRIDGRTVGSELIGQRFGAPTCFHGRPSAVEYNAASSGASNSGPSNKEFVQVVLRRVENVRRANGLDSRAGVPADLVTTSASGLDPHISPEAALLQVSRLAKELGIPRSVLGDLVHRHTEAPFLGFWGSHRVNVLMINLALDKIARGSGND